MLVVPLFLAKGVHIENTFPARSGCPKAQRRSFVLNGRTIPLVYADPIGSDPLLADLMIKNAHKSTHHRTHFMRILVLDTIHGGKQISWGFQPAEIRWTLWTCTVEKRQWM